MLFLHLSPSPTPRLESGAWREGCRAYPRGGGSIKNGQAHIAPDSGKEAGDTT